MERRRQENAFRTLKIPQNLIDFSSNDYLGFAKSEHVFKRTSEILHTKNMQENGSTGSRLLSGNSSLYIETEAFLAEFHQTESALLFNSGYDANFGLFSSVPQRGDFVFYDELIHASIRDGLKQSLAKSYKFKHNNLADLKTRIQKYFPAPRLQGCHPERSREIFIVTESIFSMDGDSPDLKAFADFCIENQCRLIIDEAHAAGVFGEKGEGLVQELGIESQVFARINTFGKALGCHGAAILGSHDLKNYLMNFARSFIYTTALPPHSIATIQAVYSELKTTMEMEKLRKNISFFNFEIQKYQLESKFIGSNSAIQTCIVPGNENVKIISEKLQNEGFDVRPILSPTVPEGKERLRFCLHSYNSEEEISEVLKSLSRFQTPKGLKYKQ